MPFAELIISQRQSPPGPGAQFGVKAQPKSRREQILGIWNGMLKVAVHEPAEGGRANEAILGVIAAALRIRKSELQIVGGALSRTKQVLATGIAPDELRRRFEVVLAGKESP